STCRVASRRGPSRRNCWAGGSSRHRRRRRSLPRGPLASRTGASRSAPRSWPPRRRPAPGHGRRCSTAVPPPRRWRCGPAGRATATGPWAPRVRRATCQRTEGLHSMGGSLAGGGRAAPMELPPDVAEVLLTEEMLQDKIRELAKRITDDYRDRDLLLVGVLKGAFILMSD